MLNHHATLSLLIFCVNQVQLQAAIPYFSPDVKILYIKKERIFTSRCKEFLHQEGKILYTK